MIVLKPSKYRFLYSFLIKTVMLAGMICALFLFVITFYRTSGNAMYPSSRDGDLGVYCKIGTPILKDIVLYEKDGKDYIGRIVAVGGQTIHFLDKGGYEVDGCAPAEDIVYKTYGKGKISLKKDEYYILNDFRSDKNDSREIGVIKKNEIKGKLIYIFRGRDF